MTDTTLLKNVIRASGLKMSYIAHRLGISRQSLHTRLKGEVEFKPREIGALCDILSLSIADKERIFFSQKRE